MHALAFEISKIALWAFGWTAGPALPGSPPDLEINKKLLDGAFRIPRSHARFLPIHNDEIAAP